MFDHQPKDPCKDARAKIQIRVNKNQENTFFGLFCIYTKKVILFKFSKVMSLLKRNIQIPFPLSTDWHPSFFFRVEKFFKGLKGGFPQKISPFFLLLCHDNRLTWNYRLCTASYDDYSCQNLTKKKPEGVFAPPPE